ncbi:porin [Falsiphaeobacter marinintestinus]|uniref:porin n=1 Tax=Falsiphaeobacter marinintestinus TaxID=1492905 RepID=UPI0011B701FC|nr:porin [Phaeobacter marinintestinus]
MRRTSPFLIWLFASAFWVCTVQGSKAQEGDLNAEQDSSQNWANNWSRTWQERLQLRQDRLTRFLNWELSDTTLLSFYGQLNFLYLDYDDGVAPFTSIRDNGNSPGRLGLRLETNFENGTGLLVNLETGLRRSTYDGIFRGGGVQDNFEDWGKTLLRKAELRLSIPSVGFLSFGQGSMAGDGITGFDFSRTGVIATNSVGDTISGVPAYFATGVQSASQLQSFFPIFDASRRFRVRYDSVAKRGLSWSTSVGQEILIEGDNNTYADVALRYETEWRSFRIKTGVAAAHNDSSPDFFSGSVAGIDETTGLNFAIAGGADSRHGRYVYGKLGLVRPLFDFGDTAISIDFYHSNAPRPGANSSRSWGASIVQGIRASQTQLYATYRRYDLDAIGGDIQDASIVAAGVRFLW